MGPTWILSAPDGPYGGPMNLAIRVYILQALGWHKMETYGGKPWRSNIMRKSIQWPLLLVESPVEAFIELFAQLIQYACACAWGFVYGIGPRVRKPHVI